MKDIARLGLAYRLTQRDLIQIERHWSHFDSQFRYYDSETEKYRKDLGSGQIWQFEATHALRSGGRDLNISVFWSENRFDWRSPQSKWLPKNNAFVAVLPKSFRLYGFRFSTDMRFENEYTRAWRPYASGARTWHSKLNAGYEASIGIAGSVFGADHLSIGWKLSKGGSDSGDKTREIGLTYRIHY